MKSFHPISIRGDEAGAGALLGLPTTSWVKVIDDVSGNDIWTDRIVPAGSILAIYADITTVATSISPRFYFEAPDGTIPTSGGPEFNMSNAWAATGRQWAIVGSRAWDDNSATGRISTASVPLIAPFRLMMPGGPHQLSAWVRWFT